MKIISSFTGFIKELFCRFNDDDILALSGQLAYSLVLAFFPFLIFLITIISYSVLNSEDVILGLRDILPAYVFQVVNKTLVEVLTTRRPHLLSFSLAFSIWTASGGFNAVIKGLNRSLDEPETRRFWKVQLTSILYMFALVITIMVTLMLLVFGEVIGRFMISHWANASILLEYMWDVVRHSITLLAMTFVFAALYRYAPSRRLSWLQVLPGALFATLGWLLASTGFAFYVDNIANYSILYGSIGAIIVLMIWIFFSANIILIGGEINAAFVFADEGKTKPRCKRY